MKAQLEKITNSDLLDSLVQDAKSCFEDVIKRRQDTGQFYRELAGPFKNIFNENIDCILSLTIASLIENLQIYSIFSQKSTNTRNKIEQDILKTKKKLEIYEAGLKESLLKFFSVKRIIKNLDNNLEEDLYLVQEIHNVKSEFNRIMEKKKMNKQCPSDQSEIISNR